jgi:hypothetical protein
MSDKELDLAGIVYNVDETSKRFNRHFMENAFSSYRDNQLFPTETSYSIPGYIKIYQFDGVPEENKSFGYKQVYQSRNLWYDPKSPPPTYKH